MFGLCGSAVFICIMVKLGIIIVAHDGSAVYYYLKVEW